MGGTQKLLKLIFNKKAFKKITAYMLLIGALFFFKDFLGIFFLTFIFAYLFFSLAKFFQKKFKRFSNNRRWLKIFQKVPLWAIVLLEYVVFIGIIVYFISNIVPAVKQEVQLITEEVQKVTQLKELKENHESFERALLLEGSKNQQSSGYLKIVEEFKKVKMMVLEKLESVDPEDNLHLQESIVNLGTEIKPAEIGKTIAEYLTILGSNTLKVILALVLSFIFIIDRKKLGNYLYKVKESNFGFLYTEYDLLLEKVVKSFGLILKAQSMIALANAVITMVGFYLIGLFFGGFPYILTLTLVVFIFSFIPILGMWLSGIPLALVAYMTGGIEAVLFTVMMVFFTTSVEAYYLNPKIVSSFLEIPMSLTFVILIISEHFFGLAGLLIGISLFYFLMGLLEDFNKMLGKKKKRVFRKRKKL